jgi:hypothetical protein
MALTVQSVIYLCSGFIDEAKSSRNNIKRLLKHEFSSWLKLCFALLSVCYPEYSPLIQLEGGRRCYVMVNKDDSQNNCFYKKLSIPVISKYAESPIVRFQQLSRAVVALPHTPTLMLSSPSREQSHAVIHAICCWCYKMAYNAASGAGTWFDFRQCLMKIGYFDISQIRFLFIPIQATLTA